MKKLTKKDPKKTSLLLLGTNPIYTLLPALTMGLDVQRQTYEELLAGERLSFVSDTLHIMFFFPYPFWDTFCEKENSDVIYGVNRDIYERFKKYWTKIEKALKKNYPNKTLDFIIDPKKVFIDRDKILTHDLLKKGGVQVTDTIQDRRVEEVLKYITSSRGIFIKSRYGAEGKGITRLRKDKWMTNYAVKKHRPANHKPNDHWNFIDITNDKKFIQYLLEQDVIVEKEILCEKKSGIGKFDVRVHIVGGEVVHMFVRHAKSKDIVTNWSQGGKVNHAYTLQLSPKQIASAAAASKAAAKILGERFLGIDCMFDRENPNEAIVVEAQCMCSFPKPEACNLGALIGQHAINS